MKWFEGSISSAIQNCREQKAIFVVFIESEDEKGVHMRSLWDDIIPETIPAPIVAIHLKEKEEATRQFADIYPTPILPASYFIDLVGKPIEIVTLLEELNGDKFMGKIQKAAQIFNSVQPKSSPNPSSSISAPSHSSTISHPSPSLPTPSQSSTLPPGGESALSMEEKLRKAKQLLEEKKAREEEEKKATERAQELERIKAGKMMQDIQKQRQEKELLEAAAERRRDKLEAEKVKERVKAQIKADREEREYRLNRSLPTQSTENKKEEGDSFVPQSIPSDRCRLQVRFPDGSTMVEDLPSNDVLATVVEKIRQSDRVSGPFKLSQMYPRRVFDEDDHLSTFIQLNLTPSSTLLVIQSRPTKSGVVAASPLGGIYSLFTLLFLAPLQYAFAFVQSIFGGGSGGSSATQPSQESVPSSSNTDRGAAAEAALRRRRDIPGPSGSGNVHGVNNTNGDDEDKDKEASWNGNSTQFL